MVEASTPTHDDVIHHPLPTPSFTTFKSDITMKVPIHLVHHLVDSSFRIYAECNRMETMKSFGLNGVNWKDFNNPHSREIRGMVRENSRGEKLVSFSCSTLDRAGYYDVFVHVYDLEKTFFLISFVMNWPNIELRSIQSVNIFQIEIIDTDTNKEFCCSISPNVHLAFEVCYVGPNPRFQEELQSPPRLIHIEQISRRFNNGKSIHDISPCVFYKPGLYSIKLVSIYPPIILNSTMHRVLKPSAVQMEATDLIGGCLDHVTIKINNNITCASESDRIRMVTVTRSKFKHNEIYVSERKVKDDQSQFECSLLEGDDDYDDDDGDDDDRDGPDDDLEEVCWEYVSVGLDGSVHIRGRHCEMLNPNTSLTDRSGWSECVSEGVKVRKEKCFMKATCQAVQFVTCLKTGKELYNNNNNKNDNNNNNKNNMFKPPTHADVNETCNSTFNDHNATITSSCTCNHGSRHLITSDKRLIRLTFAFLSAAILNRQTRIVSRDGGEPTSDVIFDSWHGDISEKSFNLNITSRTGIMLIETHSPICEGAVFVASYFTIKKKRPEEDEEVEGRMEYRRRDGDEIVFAAVLVSILSVMLVLVFSTFRRNRIRC